MTRHEHERSECSTHNAWLIAALAASLSAACAGCLDNEDPVPSRETNWLRRCSDDGDCNSAGSCKCGLCSEHCSEDSDCPSGLVCKSAESALVRSACGAMRSNSGLCAPSCERDSDCANGQRCASGACEPASSATGGDGGVAGSSGPSGPRGDEMPTGRTPQAYVVAAVQPDSSCTYAAANQFLQTGQYDIAPGATSGSNGCENGYRIVLEIANDEPGVLQLSGAWVKLTTLQRESLVFDSQDDVLPNPFTYTSSRTLLPSSDGQTAIALYEVEAIRAPYAPYLGDFVGDQLMVEVRLQGTDEQDQPIAFRPFLFPIEICDGCLSRCASFLTEMMLQREDFAMDRCDDNAGADGRMCWDPDC